MTIESTPVSFGFPGYLELLIIGIVVLVPVITAIVLLAVVAGRRRAAQGNPNLTPCSDCGHAVSVRAECCPHCGGPLKGRLS